MPDLVAALGGDEANERALIERLITRGDARDWLHYLRARTESLIHAVQARGRSREVNLMAAILLDQFLLAPGVCDLTPGDLVALKQLERLRPAKSLNPPAPAPATGRSAEGHRS